MKNNMHADVKTMTHSTGVIVVLGLGTALRLALDFCIKWSFRRPVQRADANVNHGYHPAL